MVKTIVFTVKQNSRASFFAGILCNTVAYHENSKFLISKTIQCIPCVGTK